MLSVIGIYMAKIRHPLELSMLSGTKFSGTHQTKIPVLVFRRIFKRLKASSSKSLNNHNFKIKALNHK